MGRPSENGDGKRSLDGVKWSLLCINVLATFGFLSINPGL